MTVSEEFNKECVFKRVWLRMLMTVCKEFDETCEKQCDKECLKRVCEIKVCKLDRDEEYVIKSVW